MSFEDLDDDVGLGTEDRKHIKSSKIERFTGEQGYTYRVALMYFHPLEYALTKAMKRKNPQVTATELQEKLTILLENSAKKYGKAVDQLAPWEKLDTSNVQFKKFETQYKENIGSFVSRLGKDGEEADKVWKQMGEKKEYYLTVYLVYPTTKDGQVKKEELGSSYTKLARLSGKAYEALHACASSLRENELSIASQDLNLKCTNKDFQNFEITAAGPSIWLKNPAFASKMLQSAYEQYESLDKVFRQISTADLRIKLGFESGSESVSAGGMSEFEGLLDSAI